MNTDSENMTFKEMLKVSFKSDDTEEWLDVHFTRPIGLMFALFWMKFDVHPNVVTILSIFLGVAAGVMFGFPDLLHNILGVILLMLANFGDSTDGQMARLTGKKTLVGRVLDGFSGDVNFAVIYTALSIRLTNVPMPGTDINWGIAIWILCFAAGVLGHIPEASLSDYYRQIHLWFLKGKDGSELDNYAQQRQIYETLPKEGPLVSRLFYKAFYFNYANYCKGQEERTPHFQKLYAELLRRYGSPESLPDDLKNEFLEGSRPLMKYTNLLTFNSRAICLYVACLLNEPWLYPLVEVIIHTGMYVHMHRSHEFLCKRIYTKYFSQENEEMVVDNSISETSLVNS